jgi:hypothetical protein
MEDATQEHAEPDRIVVRVPKRALLVIGGLAGAGKSTLLRNTVSTVPVAVLDTDQMRARLAAFFPDGTPYSWYRPLAPVLHRLRLLVMVMRAPGPVVVHHTATAATSRLAFVLLGALARRPCQLIWVDCTPSEAFAGQLARGRLRLRSSFARQVRRMPALRRRLRAGIPPRGWRAVQIVDRSATIRGLQLVVC